MSQRLQTFHLSYVIKGLSFMSPITKNVVFRFIKSIHRVITIIPDDCLNFFFIVCQQGTNLYKIFFIDTIFVTVIVTKHYRLGLILLVMCII